MGRTSLKKIVVGLAILIFVAPQPSVAQATKNSAQHDWPIYGGTPENNHYSTLSQINRENVKELQVAWSYDTGESGGLQTSPIIVGGVLYAYTPSQKVIALNAATGMLLWKFDPAVHGWQPARGLAYWSDGKEKRILAGVMNSVYALDAATGKPIPSFGDNGHIDLRKDLGRDPETQSIALTSPGVVYKDLLIIGGRDPETLPAPPGDIRAYSIRTGKLAWSFHTIPHPGEFGYDTWPKDAWKYIGSANNWTGMTVDASHGIVYVPTGSAAFDFYGGNRLGDDLFANSLIALNADTGKRIWHFQAVRHDIWDRDFPSPPVLTTVQREGKKIDAVAQPTKQGFVYLFDRATGKPLFPIEYQKYPASDVPGEVAAIEQPLPTKPAPYARQRLTEDLLTNRNPEAHRSAVEQFHKLRSDGQFVPMTVGQDTVIFPGFDGGAEWGGSAADPTTGILYLNSNEMAWIASLAENIGNAASGRGIYQSQCSVCHRDDKSGSPPQFPSLIGIADRMSPNDIAATVSSGKGRMPGFTSLTHDQLEAVVDYVMSGESKELQSSGEAAAGDEIPLHWIQKVPRPARLSRRRSALGYVECDQPEHRRVRLEDSAGRISRTGRAGTEKYRKRKLRRTCRHSRRPAVHRSHKFRQKIPRLRQIHWRIALGNHAAVLRQRHPSHLRNRWTPICRHRRRLRQRPKARIRRDLRSLCPTSSFGNCASEALSFSSQRKPTPLSPTPTAKPPSPLSAARHAPILPPASCEIRESQESCLSSGRDIRRGPRSSHPWDEGS